MHRLAVLWRDYCDADAMDALDTGIPPEEVALAMLLIVRWLAKEEGLSAPTDSGRSCRRGIDSSR